MSVNRNLLLCQRHAGFALAFKNNSFDYKSVYFCLLAEPYSVFPQLAASSSTEQISRQKFAVHTVLLSLKSVLARDPNAFGASIQTVIAQYVLPDVQSPFPFLRGKACEVNPSTWSCCHPISAAFKLPLESGFGPTHQEWCCYGRWHSRCCCAEDRRVAY
jgi:hypothetical protein